MTSRLLITFDQCRIRFVSCISGFIYLIHNQIACFSYPCMDT